MEQEYHLDLEDVQRRVAAADVITLFFPLLSKTLLVDLRANSIDPPLVRIVPSVRRQDERLRALRHLRPRFAAPACLTSLPWWASVAGAKRSGLWQVMVDRLTEHVGSRAELLLECCYRELLVNEREETRRAILGGAGYETLWQRRLRSER